MIHCPSREVDLLLLALMFGCGASDMRDYVRDDTDSSDTDTDMDTDTNEDTDTDVNTPDTGDPWWDDPARKDVDNDGYSVVEGDCNDMNPAVNPGISVDTCNGVDNDCDGDIDEDVNGDDGEYQNIGNLTDEEEFFLYPTLFPHTDVDTFDFYVEDTVTGWFDIEVWLYQVPDDADYWLEMYWVEDSSGDDRGLVQTADANGVGGFEVINYGGVTGRDDSGWYRIVIQSQSGASCSSPYQLQFLIGGW